MDATLAQRKEKVFEFLSAKKNWIIYLLVAGISLFSYKVRTTNLANLIDITTGKHLSIELDTFVILRYVKQILAQGYLNAVDPMRYYPGGYQQVGEFSVLSYVIAALYKFFHFFSSSITVEYVDVVYPPLVFSFTLIVFFLLVRKLFDYRVALLATAYLAVIPSLLQRTVAGFSDKESLALFLFVLTFYFYISSWKSSSSIKGLIYGGVAGVTTGLMGLTWGGVQFVFLIIGFFQLAEFILDKATKGEFYTYLAWSMTSLAVLIHISDRYNLATVLYSLSFGITYFVLFVGIIDYMLKKYDFFRIKTRVEKKIPIGLFSFMIAAGCAILFVLATTGVAHTYAIIQEHVSGLINPFGQSRWGVTVAESHQPFLIDVINEHGKIYFAFFIIGSILLFYQMIKHFHKHKIALTAFYAVFFLMLTFSRYASNSTLNGTNTISLVAFMGSLLVLVGGFLAYYVYAYKKDKNMYENIISINKAYIFVFVWLMMKILATRIVVRLILLFGFATAIFVAYFFIRLFDYARQRKNSFVKYTGIAFLIVLILIPSMRGTLASYTDALIKTAPNIGPAYNQQWQIAMKWVRENTPKDSVFIGWWDYGYWVQGGGERATVADGGNVGGQALNYYTGRHILTSPNDTEALAFIKAKEATHFITLSDDIGKYPAYSSIGSDLKNDRYSWINTFNLNPAYTQETRNSTLYFYEGSFVLDEDVIYDDKLYPERAAGIGGFIVPIEVKSNNTSTMRRPSAILMTRQQQATVPLNCIVFNKQKVVFAEDGLDGCLVLIPRIDGDKFDPKGSSLYVSRKVKDSLFARLYIYGMQVPHFTLAYTDEDQVPLAVYNGRLFGPLKIWNVTVPEDIVVDPALKKKELPDPRLYYVVK